MGTAKCTLDFTYGTKTATFLFHADSQTYTAAGTKTAGDLRNAISGLFETQSRGTSIHVTKHYSSTPAKLGGSIHQSARVVYEITIPVSMAGHDDNGGLTALTVAKDSTAEDTKFSVAMYQMGDNSEAIANALTSLPNSVIPGVTVTKEGVTDSDTNSAGSSGNAYAQSYAITFNSESNAGDQNMLSCNAGPCDEDGCLNRGPGVSEVRYMRHDPENHGEGINFVSQGYFIMDIGKQSTDVDLSAGSIKIMWDTGSGISSAIFAVVATASEVQTALRTITGWGGVTVELWGSRKGNTAAAAHILSNHQFKVTFAAGYDDMGKSPTFYTMTTSDGAYADADNARAKLYDQRFSNSIWLGKTTGYFEVLVADDESTADAQFTKVGSKTIALNIQPQSGNIYYFSEDQFGAGAGTSGGNADVGTQALHATPASSSPGAAEHGIDADGATARITCKAGTSIPVTSTDGASGGTKLRFAYLQSSVTSRQTSDYFAVGATVEVLPTTRDDGAKETSVTDYSNNVYRKFKVTGHVTNPFNTEFAKLDAFPSAEANSQPVETGAASATKIQLDDLPDYNLKITDNNGTVRSYENTATIVTVNEVQVLVLRDGLSSTKEAAFKLSYKGEMSQDMDEDSSPSQIAEEINGFSALSGPVTVVTEGDAKFVVTFDAADGDVAQLEAHASDSAKPVSVVTRENGWSIEAPFGTNLDTMQAGGTINVTAAEVCTFTITTTVRNGASNALGNEFYYFCYDGICGSTPEDVANTDPVAAIHSIKDDNGNQILTVTGNAALDGKVYTVTMPLGKSCDGLEMRVKTAVNTAEITKSVNKHNNGKVFKIPRSFVQIEEAADAADLDDQSDTALTFGDGKGHSALPGATTVVISDKGSGTTCAAHIAAANNAVGDFGLPFYRPLATAVHGGTAFKGTIGATAGAVNDDCGYSLRRYVITLDSMPTASNAGVGAISTIVEKTLLYKSPVGSCNVAETTKGTFESYECSNRGACDGKSGLCACYEGYSGESCQTQTVLV